MDLGPFRWSLCNSPSTSQCFLMPHRSWSGSKSIFNRSFLFINPINLFCSRGFKKMLFQAKGAKSHTSFNSYFWLYSNITQHKCSVKLLLHIPPASRGEATTPQTDLWPPRCPLCYMRVQILAEFTWLHRGKTSRSSFNEKRLQIWSHVDLTDRLRAFVVVLRWWLGCAVWSYRWKTAALITKRVRWDKDQIWCNAVQPTSAYFDKESERSPTTILISIWV